LNESKEKPMKFDNYFICQMCYHPWKTSYDIH
jgi:hypothetical protein